MKNKLLLLLTLSVVLLPSCNFRSKTESNLTQDDLNYINSIIPLDEDENIEMFDSQGGFKGVEGSGNFYTNKRIGAYWIDGKDDQINSAKYEEIDSIKTVDKVQAVTFASYLDVYSSKGNFKVYIDADSSRTWAFFKGAIELWESKK